MISRRTPTGGTAVQVTDEMVEAEELWENFQSRRFLHGHRETPKESFLAAYEAALSKAEPVGVGVKVKPLEWSVYGGDAYAFSGVTQKAYSISFEEGKYWAAWDAALASFGTLNEAKAAAQADYEQRILSALSLPCKENGETVTPVANVLAESARLLEVCRKSGICMTCVLGAPDTYGCSDCLNTGWNGGSPPNSPEEIKQIFAGMVSDFSRMKARAIQAEKVTTK